MNHELNRLTERIIHCAIEVHKTLGPGLLESIYESALAIELDLNGISYRRQPIIPVTYKGHPIGECRLDLIVDAKVVVELKAVERHDPIFEAQTLTYLKVSGCIAALLLNFNYQLLKEGIRRFLSSPPLP